jgi:hypothetical protein
MKLKAQLQRLRTLRVVTSDRNDCDEVKTRVAACCERAAQALIDVEMLADRMGISFPTKLMGEDPTTDLTGTDFMLYETDPWQI